MRRLNLRKALWALPLALVAAAAAVGCGSDHAVVGGSCASGFVQCGDHCVLEDENCGGCGIVCGAGTSCLSGQCVAPDGAVVGPVEGGATAEGGSGVDAGDGATNATSDAAGGDGAIGEGAPGDDGSIVDGGGDGTGATTDGSGADSRPSGDGAGTDGPSDDGGTSGDGGPSDGGPSDGGPSSDGTLGGDAAHGGGDAADGGDGSSSDGTLGGDAISSGDASMGNDSSAAGDAPVDGGSAGDAADALSSTCEAGQGFCNGACVDLTSDPNNCGSCNNACASGICTNGVCVGSTPGSVIAIGHDFETTTPSHAQARVLTNAVFLAPALGVPATQFNVLTYERYADPTAISEVHALLAAATPPGDQLTITATQTDSDVTQIAFGAYSALVILDQPNVPSGTDLGLVGAQWASSLATFTNAGGVVVVLDGATGADQMPALVTGTGLLAVAADLPLTAGTFLYVHGSDSVGVGVVSPYFAGVHTATLVTEPNGGAVTYVVAPASDADLIPVVVHKSLP